jgi:hypothetical protein
VLYHWAISPASRNLLLPQLWTHEGWEKFHFLPCWCGTLRYIQIRATFSSIVLANSAKGIIRWGLEKGRAGRLSSIPQSGLGWEPAGERGLELQFLAFYTIRPRERPHQCSGIHLQSHKEILAGLWLFHVLPMTENQKPGLNKWEVNCLPPRGWGPRLVKETTLSPPKYEGLLTWRQLKRSKCRQALGSFPICKT